MDHWFSETFTGTIWNILAHPTRNIIFLEVRQEDVKKVCFFAYDLDVRDFVFRDLIFDEPWWINLAEVSENILIFTIYTDTNNPDKKSIIAFDFVQKKTIWWRNNFSLSAVNEKQVLGSDTGSGMKFLSLNLVDGLPGQDGNVLAPRQNFLVRKPLQYFEQTSHFETVRSFLQVKHQISAISVIEYLELQSLLFIGYYEAGNGLANYLIVLNTEGQILLKEKIGEHLKGIGVDTFFILSGYLIFVKNKRELISYKMV